MLKKTIVYQDFNGERVEEEAFFHLSKAELVEMELSHQGGLTESLKRIVAAEDGKAIILEFKNILLGSYGKRSEDGRRFIKNQALREEFESSEAYSTLFMELVTDTDAAIEFVNGIIPKDMAQEVAATVNDEAKRLESVELKPMPVVLTRREVQELPEEEYRMLASRIASGEVKLGD